MTSPEINLVKLQAVLDDYRANAQRELQTRWDAWEKDLSEGEVYEVVGALLARQTTVATQLVDSPAIWNDHMATIILRAMADVHITLAWILKDPLTRSRRFVHYGLGQMKLQVEHRKSRWSGGEPDDRKKQAVAAMEGWIDSQHYGFLTEVSVGNWSEMSVREMAQEAGITDFYNFVYAPFSGAVHSMWHYVAQHNTVRCQNPLHRYHRLPAILELGSDPFYAILAAKYLNKSFSAFDNEALATQVEVVNSFQQIRERLQAVFDMQDDGSDANDEC